jgi:hypothetical protein
MFIKIYKFEMRDMKAYLIGLSVLLAMIGYVLYLGILNYSNTMSSFKESFQEKELSLLDFYNEDDGYLFKPEQIRFHTCLIPSPYSHFLNGKYPAIYANVGIDPLFTYSEIGYCDMTGEGLGFNTILFYFCLFALHLRSLFKVVNGQYSSISRINREKF